MPTEAEWEYACRAGTTTPYAGASLDLLGWYLGNSGLSFEDLHVRDVRWKSPNARGLYDMHGNVWVWCEDWCDFDYYDTTAQTDPTGPSSGLERVIRGGSCFSYSDECRSANRIGQDPANRRLYLGFRIVLSR